MTLYDIKKTLTKCQVCGYDLNGKNSKQCIMCESQLEPVNLKNMIGKAIAFIESKGYIASSNYTSSSNEVIITLDKPLDLYKNHVIIGGLFRASKLLFIGFSEANLKSFWVATPKHTLSNKASHYER